MSDDTFTRGGSPTTLKEKSLFAVDSYARFPMALSSPFPPAGRLGAALALLALCGTARADILPTRYAEAGADRARVALQLETLGMSAAEAGDRTSRLSDADARYLSAHPARVRLAGAEVSSIELILGAAFVVGGIVATVVFLSD